MNFLEYVWKNNQSERKSWSWTQNGPSLNTDGWRQLPVCHLLRRTTCPSACCREVDWTMKMFSPFSVLKQCAITTWITGSAADWKLEKSVCNLQRLLSWLSLIKQFYLTKNWENRKEYTVMLADAKIAKSNIPTDLCNLYLRAAKKWCKTKQH